MTDWWQSDPVVKPASAGGDWWKSDPIVHSSGGGARGVSAIEDVLPSLNEGLNRGADALIGSPGDIWHGARYLANRVLGYNDPINDILPTSESLRARREEFSGPRYEPQTTAGEYARTIGEFVPGAALAPEKSIGSAILKYGVAPGVASETAGQVMKGTPIEPYARTAAAVAGGFAPSLVERGRQAGKSFLEPFTEEGRQNIAARGFRGGLYGSSAGPN